VFFDFACKYLGHFYLLLTNQLVAQPFIIGSMTLYKAKNMIKKTLLSLTLLLSFSSLFAQKIESPVEYNNYIVEQQGKLMHKVVEYIVQTVHNDNFEEVENRRLQVLGQIEVAITKLESLEKFNKEDNMRDEALAVFKLYKKSYSEDFSEINLLKQDREGSFEDMERYFQAQDKAEKAIYEASDRLHEAQRAFAETHKMTIEEAEKDETMSIIANVNKYGRDVFLEYFKVSKLNGACLDALNEQNADKLEENRLLLLKGTEEAYSNLKNIVAYKNDEDYKNKAMAYVAYNKLFATKDLATLVTVLGNNERTNEDVETYNKIIAQYNQDATDLLEQFNSANMKLMRTHIPKTTTQVGEKE
jgi:hypothetical protein